MQKFKISKKQNLEQGALILLLSTVLTKIIGALFKIPLSSNFCLGDLGFGYFSAAYDLFTPVYMLAISGFPVAVSRLVAEYTAKDMYDSADNIFKSLRKVLIILGIIGTLILTAAVIPFSLFSDNGKGTSICYFAIIPAFLFCCIVSAYRGYYEGILNMVPAAVSNIIEALGKLVLGFTFALFAVKITGDLAISAAFALFGITLGTLISAFYLHLKFKSDLKESSLKSNNIDKLNLSDVSIAKTLLFTAVPIVISSLSGSLVTLIDTLTVRFQLMRIVEQNAAALALIYADAVNEYNSFSKEVLTANLLPTFLYGIRSKAFTIYNLIPTLTTALGVSAVPVLTEAFARGDRRKVKDSTKSLLKMISLIVFPAAFGMLFIPDRIMALLYGQSSSANLGGRMLWVLAITAIFSGFSVPLCSMLQALSLEKNVFLNVGIGIFVKLIGNWVLCPILNINIMGSVYSTLFCYILIFILNFISLIKIIGYDFKILSVLLKPFFAALTCGMSAFLISKIGESSFITALSIVVGGMVYLVFLLFSKAVSKEEMINFIKK